MINREIIENSLYEWLSAVTNIKWLTANQNVAVPKSTFGTIFLLGINKVGEDIRIYEYNQILDNITENVEGPRDLFVDLNIYGKGAFDFMSLISASVYQEPYNSQLLSSGVGFIEHSQIRDISEVISARWSERAQADFRFYITSAYQTTINRIAETSISGKIDDKDINIIVQDN